MRNGALKFYLRVRKPTVPNAKVRTTRLIIFISDTIGSRIPTGETLSPGLSYSLIQQKIIFMTMS